MEKGKTQTNEPKDKKIDDYANIFKSERLHRRLYESRKEGRRGLTSIDASFDASIQRHKENIKKSKKY